MAISISRATPIYTGKAGGHVRFRFLGSSSPSPTQSPVVLATIDNATLLLAAPQGDLRYIMGARDYGIGSIAAGTALTQAQARAIMLCDENAAAAGSEAVLTNNNVPRARTSCVLRGVPANGVASAETLNTKATNLVPAVDVNVDSSGRIVIELRLLNTNFGGSTIAFASPVVGYVDIMDQHSLFRR